MVPAEFAALLAGGEVFLRRKLPVFGQGFTALGIVALYAGVYALRGRGDRLTAYLLGLGAVFVTIAVPIYSSGDTRAVAWATQVLVFTIIGLRYRSERTLAAAMLVFVLSFAVLGAVFVGVSYLYQRYRARLGIGSPNWGVGHRT